MDDDVAVDPLLYAFGFVDHAPRSTVVLFQSGLVSVCEITYLGIALNLSATSPFIVGEVLERSGLVIRSRRAQLRPSRLQAAPLEKAVTCLENYRRFWESSFDRLEERVQADERDARGA